MYPFEDDEDRILDIEEDDYDEKKYDQSDSSENEHSKSSHNSDYGNQKGRMNDDIQKEDKMYNQTDYQSAKEELTHFKNDLKILIGEYLSKCK